MPSEAKEEVFIYAGNRIVTGDKLGDCFVDLSGHEYVFNKRKGDRLIGGRYKAMAVRGEGDKSATEISIVGDFIFFGNPIGEVRQEWLSRHNYARAWVVSRAAEKKYGQGYDLDKAALADLRHQLQSIRGTTPHAALLALIIKRLLR